MASISTEEGDCSAGPTSPDFGSTSSDTDIGNNPQLEKACELPPKMPVMRRQSIPAEIINFAQGVQMPVEQVNGQRILGPNPRYNSEWRPGTGSEIYVTRLPRDCFEDELWDVFNNVGALYQVRMMMDFSGTNRGYCFIKFFTAQIAHLAIKYYNNYEIRRGTRIRVMRSVDNKRLLLEGLPTQMNLGELRMELQNKVEGFTDVYVEDDKGRDRKCKRKLLCSGTAFLEFSDHRIAAVTRGKLLTSGLALWGISIHVDWADPSIPGQLWNRKRLIKAWRRGKRGPRNEFSPSGAMLPEQPWSRYGNFNMQRNIHISNWQTNNIMNPVWQSNGLRSLPDPASAFVGQPWTGPCGPVWNNMWTPWQGYTDFKPECIVNATIPSGAQKPHEYSSVIYTSQPSAYLPVHMIPYGQDAMINYVESAPSAYQQTDHVNCEQYDYHNDYPKSGYLLRNPANGNFYDCVFF